jgi:taurine dioxygenase
VRRPINGIDDIDEGIPAMKVRRLAGAVGAEISGVDLTQPISVTLAQEIRDVWLAHEVIFLRDQPLSSQQFMDFANAMGEPVEYPFVKGIDGFPHIIEVKKLEHERVNFGGVWHSDTTYLDLPPMGSMLLAKEIPPFGGDTLFASQYAAYEALSDTMQRLLSGLQGINSSAKADVSKTREDRLSTDGKTSAPKSFTSKHPVVRTHPETGRKALYVNVAHTSGIEGLTELESASLLKFLFDHQVKPEFTCRWAWEPHALAFWDNRCVQHNPVNDYHGYRRVLQRITLQGDKPV